MAARYAFFPVCRFIKGRSRAYNIFQFRVITCERILGRCAYEAAERPFRFAEPRAAHRSAAPRGGGPRRRNMTAAAASIKSTRRLPRCAAPRHPAALPGGHPERCGRARHLPARRPHPPRAGGGHGDPRRRSLAARRAGVKAKNFLTNPGNAAIIANNFK